MRIEFRRVLGGASLMTLVAVIPTSTSAQHADAVADLDHGLLTSAYAVPAGASGVEGAETPDSLYREARQALNRREFDRAARLFRQVRVDYPDSEYAADAYYFEAFSIFRGSPSRADLERANSLLDEREDRFPESASEGDAPGLRVQIESALARTGDGAAARRIASRAADAGNCDPEDQELRAMALNALLMMDSDRAMPILTDILASRDECSRELRLQAVFLVSQHMTDETVDILIDLAHRDPDPDSEIREQAVFWLAQVDSPEAFDALDDILRNSGDAELQEHALFAMSQHSSDRAAATLREFAQREGISGELQEQAVFWLGQTEGGGAFLRELYSTSGSMELREQIIAGVAQGGGADDSAWLLERAMDPSEASELRAVALFWAAQSGIPAERLGDLYNSADDPEVKEQAIFALAQASDTEAAVTILMDLAEAEEDTEFKTTIIFWLGQTDDPRIPDFLLRILRG